MPKVKLVAPAQYSTVAQPGRGERFSGRVETVLGISGAFPLEAGFRRMAAGASIEWAEVESGLVVHVWEGSARFDGVALAQDSVVVIEHGARAKIDAGVEGAQLLVFDAGANVPPADAAGGNVHVLPSEQVQRAEQFRPDMNIGVAIYADSTCPSCRLWLHANSYRDPHYEATLHSHSQDEIIVVTDGEMVIGNRRYGRGAMLAVGKDVLYGFKAGPEGMRFINFRPSHPTYTSGDGTIVADEAATYRAAFGSAPPYHDFAAAR